MLQPPDRARSRRKWSAYKKGGPLLLYCELVQKKLIQHSWPCDKRLVVRRSRPVLEGESQELHITEVHFIPLKGRAFGPAFFTALDVAMRIVSHERNVRAFREGLQIFLDGPYYVDRFGAIRAGDVPPPF